MLPERLAERARALALIVGAPGAVVVAALVGILGGTAPTAAAPTCTMNFIATSGGAFLTASNWDVNRLPGSTDYACIPATVTGAVTYSGTVTIAGVDDEGAGGFSATSGTLTLTDTTNGSTFTKLALGGATITGAANVTLKGATSWSAGTMSGTGTTTLSTTGVLTDTNPNGWNGGVILQRPFTNHGTITLPAGDALNFQGGAVLTNTSDGTIDLHGDNTRLLPGNGTTGSVINNGAITRSLGTGTATIGVPLTTSLSNLHLAAGTGTLSMNAGATLSGTANLPTGSTLSFDTTNAANYAMNTVTINGPGVTHLNTGTNGNTWTLSGTNTVNSPFSFNGGSIAGAGNVMLTGSVTWAGGTMSGTGTTTLSTTGVLTDTNPNGWNGGVILQRPFTNHGTITLPAGDALNFQGGAVLTNTSDGTIDLHGDNTRLLPGNGTTGSVINNGAITRSLGTGTATIGVPLTTSLSNLHLAAGTGTLSMNAGATLSGTANLPTGSTLSFDTTNAANYAMNTVTINGPGVTHLNTGTNGNTWTLSGTNTVNSPFSFNGGSIAGAGNVMLTGSVTWAGGTMSGTGTTTLSTTGVLTDTNPNGWNGGVILQRPFTNHGTITLPAGDALNFQGGAVLTNTSDGTIDLHGDNTRLLPGNGTTGSVINNGAITRSLGTGTATIGVPLNDKSAGAVNLGTGTLAVSAGLTNSGTVVVGEQTLTVTGGMKSTSAGALHITVGPSSHGTLTAASTDALGGELAIDLESGYTPAVGTSVTLITTTGTQSGKFSSIGGQVIGATNTGWKLATANNKVTVTVRPLSDLAASISAPANATQTVPFNVDVSLTNNGPNPATGATVTLTLPTHVTVSGSLPTGCTQPTVATVRCSAGTLAVNGTKGFTIGVVASTSATDVFAATVSTANTDAVASNNRQTASVTVI